ncbi:MAG: NINE protein [Promethearchaeota archaeon]
MKDRSLNSSNYITCPVCGGEVPDDSHYCVYCGYQINESREEKPRKESQLLKCPSCGKIIEKSFKYCSFCGHELGKAKSRLVFEGNDIDTDVSTGSIPVRNESMGNSRSPMPNGGVAGGNYISRGVRASPVEMRIHTDIPISQANYRTVNRNTSPNKIVAGLLAIFLGGLGIHKFYLGKIGEGILYIIFCWTIIPSIIGFIEGIIYLVMSDDEFYQKYVWR